MQGFAKQDRVVIVGAGIMGASIAYHLAKRGARVTVLEKQRPGAGATEKSFAWINAFSKLPRSYYDLNSYGIAGWRRLSLEIPELQVQWGGSVQWAAAGEAETMRKNIARLEQWGYAAHAIDESEIPKLLPECAPGSVAAACFVEQEGTVDPMQALGTLLKSAQKLGATVEYPCEVMLQVDVPLKESPGLLAHTAPAPRMLDRLAFAPGANIKQNPDGRIVTGSDFGNASTLDTSKEFGEKLLEKARHFLPRIKEAKLETVTLGHRVLPKDDHPIVGFVKSCPNLYVAAMHSGITLSPLIGQLAAAEILDGTSVDLLKDYRLSRFA